MMFSPATPAASRNRAACGGSVPRDTSSPSMVARTTNLRMFTGQRLLYYFLRLFLLGSRIGSRRATVLPARRFTVG